MIKENKKYLYRLINILTPINLIDDETANLIKNHSYLERVENDPSIYYVIQDKDDSINAVISIASANLAVENNLGYFRNTKRGETIFVFTKTYPDNYLNCGIYDYISNKTLFSPDVDFSLLKYLAAKEKQKPYSGLYIKENNIYLISSTLVYSDEIIPESGFQHDNYYYWEFYNEPGVLYKYIKRN